MSELEPKNQVVTTAPDGVEMFKNRIRRNLRVWRKRIGRNGISCYRLYDADLHEYNAAIDFYEGRWLVVSEYAPPKTIDPEKAERRLKDLLSALTELLSIPPSEIYLKQRLKQKGKNQYNRLDSTEHRQIVHEGGLSFYVNFSDYLDTGLFLDHRLTRQMIREASQGRDVLNLFAYTGSVSVYAAAGGASSTTTLDASNTYLDWARANMELNGFVGVEHRYVRDNCLNWLQFARQSYDLIFLDPPTFSNSKTYGTVFGVQEDHPNLVRACMRRLRPDGTLFFSNNYRPFKLHPELSESFEVKEITRQTIPFDFERNVKIHHCYKISHMAASCDGA